METREKNKGHTMVRYFIDVNLLSSPGNILGDRLEADIIHLIRRHCEAARICHWSITELETRLTQPGPESTWTIGPTTPGAA